MDNLDQVLKIEIRNEKQIAATLADQLMWLIASGQIRAGERLPSVRTLARQLGIHLHTVRAAYHKLEEHHLVRTRPGAGTIVQEYEALALADRTSGTPTHTVGVIVPDLANPFYPQLLSGIEQVARDKHILLITCDTQEDHQKGKEYLKLLIAKRVDGLIIAPYGLHHHGGDQENGLPDPCCPVPVVYVDRPELTSANVLLDAAGAGYAATRHLIEHGHTEIAIITGRRDIVTLQQCYSGYRNALEESDCELDPERVFEVDKFSFEIGYAAAQNMLARRALPTAIFIAGDLLAVGAMRAFREGGLRIPEDIAIIGYNDIPLSAYTVPPLTSVRTPTYELGVMAMRRLGSIIQGIEDNPAPIILPTTLVRRRSCGCSEGGSTESSPVFTET
jgi:DNA-binding LacI/PurR family transcriptional regulator